MGTLCGFDRLVIRGTLRRLAQSSGMKAYLWATQVLLKDFGEHAQELSRRVREASEALAKQSGRPIRYLDSSAANKEAIAREIVAADRIERGLICILTAVEPCLSYEIVRNRSAQRLELQPRRRKCLHLYHYRIDPVVVQMQALAPPGLQLQALGRAIAHDLVGEARLDRREDANQPSLDPIRSHDLASDGFLVGGARIQIADRAPTLLGQGLRCLSYSPAQLLRMLAKILQQHLSGPQIGLHPGTLRQPPQGPPNHQPVEAA